MLLSIIVGVSGVSGNKGADYIGEFALYWLMASDLLLRRTKEWLLNLNAGNC